MLRFGMTEIMKKIAPAHIKDRVYIAKIARQTARITCRELAAVTGFSLQAIADIEQDRLKVSDDILFAWFTICAIKLTIQEELKEK